MLGGHLDRALPVVQQEARADPSDIDAQERYIDLMLSMELGSVAEANIRRRLAANPQSADAHYLLGRVVPTAEKATASYREALTIDPEHARAFMGLAAVYRAVGQYADAVQAYKTALSFDATLGEAWAGLTTTLLIQGRRDEALESARLSIVNVPGEAEGYLTISELAPQEALTILRQAQTQVPDDPRPSARLAELLLEAGDGPGAKTAAERAVQLAPGLGSAQLTLLFADALATGTLDAAGYRSLISARALEGDPAKARAQYDVLASSYPRCSLVFMARAAVQPTSAASVADLRKAVQLDPGNVEAQAALGLALLQTGDPEGALAALDAALQHRPNDVSLLIAASTASGRVRPGTGLARLDKAWANIQTDVRLSLVFASELVKAGASDRALDVLETSAKQVPDGRLGVAFASIAKQSEQVQQGADRLDALTQQTRNPAFAQAAAELRK